MPAAEPRRPRFAIVRATFNASITQALLDGALAAFAAAGVQQAEVTVVEVPGAFELPVAAARMARSRRFAAIVALGCVIRGETPHFEYVASAAAHGLTKVSVDTGTPVAFGVLTADTGAQALARATPGAGSSTHVGGEPGANSNKGFEAAQAALVMADLPRSF